MNKTTSEITLHSLSHDGRGIGLVDKKTAFIAGGLPTETVTYKINNKKNTYMEGEALEILSPSPERVTPPCQHFGICGGCSLQHMSDTLQIDLKQQTLLEQLKHFGQVSPETILPVLNANSLGYRRKARLGVKFVIKKNKLLIGFREKKSNYLAELERCIVLHPIIGEKFNLLRELIMSLSIYQHIPQIEIAVGDHDAALVFRHMKPCTDEDIANLKAFGKNYSYQIYLQPNPPMPVTKLWPEDNIERLSYTLPDEKLSFLFHPLDFTQINLEMNRLMVKQALSLLDLTKDETVLDLFCGIGNFTLPLAQHGKEAIGIEGSKEMVERATANALHNHITNTTFYTANLMDPPTQAEWLKPYDKLLLDPPRAGAKEILPLIPIFNPKRIVYVSCNPATLARDAGELVNKYNFSLKSGGIMNMFPHTAHIEAMAVFERS